MIKLIKNVKVYAPQYLGVKDILVCDRRIAAIDENVNLSSLKHKEIIDGTNLIAMPGFIDGHVHMIGYRGWGDSYLRPQIFTAHLSGAEKAGGRDQSWGDAGRQTRPGSSPCR